MTSVPGEQHEGVELLEFHRENRSIGRHLAEKPDVEVTMCLGPMPPDASDFPGGIPALVCVCQSGMTHRMSMTLVSGLDSNMKG